MTTTDKFDILFDLAGGNDESRRQLHHLDNIKLASLLWHKDTVRFEALDEMLAKWKKATRWRSTVERMLRDRRANGRKAAAEDAAREQLDAAASNGKPVIDADKPLEIAEAFMSRTLPHLKFWGGDWYDYAAGRYAPVEERLIKAKLTHFMASGVNAADAKPFHPNLRVITEGTDFLKSQSFKPSQGNSLPLWIDYWAGVDPDPATIIPCANGLLEVANGRRTLYPHDPRFFTVNAVPFAFQNDAPPPQEWLAFLESIWPADEGGQQNQDALQEVIGYLLTTQTNFQKIFVLVGAPRAGKSTIQNVIEGLIGLGNIASQSITNLGKDFGLAQVIGKQVLIIPDLRLGRNANIGGITEALLTISGQDTIPINRKFRDEISVRPTARILMTSNMGLVLPDQSGALTARLFPLVFTKSFEGKEDTTLTHRLLGELPSILNWALDGLERLLDRRDHRGRQIGFVLTEAGKVMVDDIKRRGSSVKAFLKDRCVMSPDLSIEKEVLLDAMNAYADEHELGVHYSPETFTKELKTASGEKVQAGQVRIEGDPRRVYKGVALK